VSPVIWLAGEVNRLDPNAPDPEAFDPDRLGLDVDDEVRALAAAMADFARRLNAFVERERNFTRDASHELRSPLTVMRMAAGMLLAEPSLDPALRTEVQRIQRSARDMEELVAAFLLLAREDESKLVTGPVCVNDLVADELERAAPLAADKPLEIASTADCRLVVEGSDKVLSVLIGNLLRNALSYTDEGRVRVHVGPRSVTIEDSGVGMAAPEVKEAFRPYFRANPQRRGGHGVGLTIVKRLSDRFAWPVTIDSEPGVGTRVEVSFPDGRCESLPGADGAEG
jgi:signal transduction histidine kinase